MPKSKAEMMKRLRKERKEAGLLYYREWVTPLEKKRIDAILVELRK